MLHHGLVYGSGEESGYVEHHATDPARPFFMYLAFDTPHATLRTADASFKPTQPSGDLKGPACNGSATPGHMINTASGTVDSWQHPDYARATWDDDHNPATPERPWPDVYKRYATCVRRIDDAVGDLLQLLKDLRIDENTLVVFTSDNGPSIESYLKEPIQPTFFASYGPFDGIKRDCWEGGMACRRSHDGRARFPPAVVSAIPSSFPDWMPTFAAAAGICAPARTDGVSLLPTLTGQGPQVTPRVYIEYFEQGRTPKFTQFEADHRNRLRRQMQALCIGDYVGVRYNILAHSDNFEIYNALTDPKEARNLGGQASFAALQQQFKDTVLQIASPWRRRNASLRWQGFDAPPNRPALGRVDAPSRREFTGRFPWTPKFDAMEPTISDISCPAGFVLADRRTQTSGSSIAGSSRRRPMESTPFSLMTAIRAHYCGYTRRQSSTPTLAMHPARRSAASILLKAGMHPVRLYYAYRASAPPLLRFEWAGPGIRKQVVPANVFSHRAEDQPEESPP